MRPENGKFVFPQLQACRSGPPRRKLRSAAGRAPRGLFGCGRVPCGGKVSPESETFRFAASPIAI